MYVAICKMVKSFFAQFDPIYIRTRGMEHFASDEVYDRDEIIPYANQSPVILLISHWIAFFFIREKGILSMS